eukprot:1141142-Pelagomonas_calceolata.AAC.1
MQAHSRAYHGLKACRQTMYSQETTKVLTGFAACPTELLLAHWLCSVSYPLLTGFAVNPTQYSLALQRVLVLKHNCHNSLLSTSFNKVPAVTWQGMGTCQ